MELKWAIGEDADGIEKVKTSRHDIMEALRASKRQDEGALLKAFKKKEAGELLAQDALLPIHKMQPRMLSRCPGYQQSRLKIGKRS